MTLHYRTWHAAMWEFPPIGRSGGSSVEHRGMAIGQRGWKRQPDGGFRFYEQTAAADGPWTAEEIVTYRKLPAERK